MQMLAPGWNGGDAPAPDPAAIRQAREFTNALPDDRLKFDFGLANDGELNAFFDRGGRRVDIIFDERGIASYYGVDASGKEIYADGPFDPFHPPAELMGFLPKT
jgi:hypothetical protein